MSRLDYDYNDYEDVFVFEDLVYAMESERGVVHVYRNHNNSLIKLHDVSYPCGCNFLLLSHSIIVTNEHIIQCCNRDEIVSILNRSGELQNVQNVVDVSDAELKAYITRTVSGDDSVTN